MSATLPRDLASPQACAARALLAHDQIDAVIEDLELLKDIRRAMEDVRDSEVSATDRLTLSITCKQGVKDQPIAFVHGGGCFLAQVALQAMEREVLSRLASKEIEVTA